MKKCETTKTLKHTHQKNKDVKLEMSFFETTKILKKKTLEQQRRAHILH